MTLFPAAAYLALGGFTNSGAILCATVGDPRADWRHPDYEAWRAERKAALLASDVVSREAVLDQLVTPAELEGAGFEFDAICGMWRRKPGFW